MADVPTYGYAGRCPTTLPEALGNKSGKWSLD